MLTFIKENIAFVLITLLAVLGGGYYFLFMQTDTGPALTESEIASPESQLILQQLASLQGIHLDEAVFKDPVFLSLTDFGVVLKSEPVGRRNPFQPISFAPSANQLPLPGKK
ncbi:MAG: hypothetical protein QG621_190 [Patescibacteria group bacterium]|nr:hypothetical protein [Patescibacteria group bacterium]